MLNFGTLHQNMAASCSAPSKCSQLRVFARSLWFRDLCGCGEWEIQQPCPYAKGLRTSWARGAELSPAAGGSYQPLCLHLFTVPSHLWFFSYLMVFYHD